MYKASMRIMAEGKGLLDTIEHPNTSESLAACQADLLNLAEIAFVSAAMAGDFITLLLLNCVPL